MNTILEKETFEKKTEYAGFWIRFAACLLDGIIVSIPLTIIMFIIFFMVFSSSGAFDVISNPEAMAGNITDQQFGTIIVSYVIIMVLSILLPLIYFAGMHASKWQATFGKRLLGIKVTDLQGNKISFLRGIGRYLAMAFLSGIFYIGYIIAAFTEKKQSLHDLIAGTVVVKASE